MELCAYRPVRVFVVYRRGLGGFVRVGRVAVSLRHKTFRSFSERYKFNARAVAIGRTVIGIRWDEE